MGALTAVVAIIVRRLGGISAAWEKIKSGAQLAWGCIKAYFHAFVAWATPYWNTFTGFVTAAWDKIYQVGVDAWGSIKSAGIAFFDWAWPIVQAWWSYQTALWGALMDVAVAAWEKIKEVGGVVLDWLSATWKSLTGSMAIDWNKVRDAIVDGFLMAEFSIRNFGKVWDLIASGLAYMSAKWFNDFEHFFTKMVPTLFKWFGDNWQVVIMAGMKAWQAYTDFIGQSLIAIFTNLPDLLRGKINLADVLAPAAKQATDAITDAIDDIARTLPNIPARMEGDVERVLREQYEKQKGELAIAFEEFRKQKLAQFGKFGLLPPELVNETKEQSKAVNAALTSPFKAAEKEIRKWEAVLYGSAEAYAHVDEYLETLNKGHEPGKPFSGIASGGGEGVRVEPVLAGGGPVGGGGAGGKSNVEMLLQEMMEFWKGYAKDARPVTIANAKVGFR